MILNKETKLNQTKFNCLNYPTYLVLFRGKNFREHQRAYALPFSYNCKRLFVAGARAAAAAQTVDWHWED